MAIAVLIDHDKGTISPSAARVIGALAGLGLPLDAIVAGENLADLAKSAASISGVRKVRVADAAQYGGQGADAISRLLESIGDQYSHIAAASAAVGRDVIPHLAARLDVMPITDVIAVHDAHRFDRPVYAGNAIETVSTAQDKTLLTIRASAFAPAGRDGSADIEPIAVGPVASAVELLVAHRTESDVPDLGAAQIVVAGGIALGSTHNFKMIEELAHVMGAAVGATRAAVDAGYAPNDWQVGQTGKVIAPDLYIAVGISGALQHLAGIQGAKKIVAINTDAEAPLMKIADVALVGDLFEIVPHLTRALAERIGKKA